jgi:multiple sugar transport system substrate-binding protein
MTGSNNNRLRGITWNHTRGYLPMVATAQRFHELNPQVRIEWSVRSLQAFADEPLARLVQSFDLLVIDHPSIGAAAEGALLLPLDSLLDSAFLHNQSTHSVGPSCQSYSHAGKQWGLAIDAAAPISGWRPDLMARAGFSVPSTWDELLSLAKRRLVTVPGLAIDSLMHLYMLCAAAGEEPFLHTGQFVSRDAGVTALQRLRELFSHCDPACLERNPIRTWELLASSDTVAYCPFAYGYSNYSRRGYGQHVIETGTLPRFDARTELRSVLGGAGLVISRHCQRPETAARYARYVAGAECQASVYFDAGGQPGHRSAWLDPEVNRRSNGFFEKTLPTLDNALLRPRFNGYMSFQDSAAPLVHRYLVHGGSETELLAGLDRLLRAAHAEHTEGIV